MKSVYDIPGLVEYINDMIIEVNPDDIASKFKSPFDVDSGMKEANGKAINTAILEIASSLPKKGNAEIQKVYTTYYLNDQMNLVRHTTKDKSMTTRSLETDIEMKNAINKARRLAIKEADVLIQYEKLFNEVFAIIVKDGFPGLGLMDKALIRKCKFVRVNKGTLSVGYSKLDRRYIVRYNPEFCIDATIEYFLNPVLDDSGSYRNPMVSEDNVLSPIVFFLSHEFAHILYRHVTNSDDSFQEDLPHYVKQYFGDAYINNSIPYLLGTDYGRSNPGGTSPIHLARSHHPIGINEQVPIDNYLKSSYAVETYKTLLGQDISVIDKELKKTLSNFLDIKGTPLVKSSLQDDLGYSSVLELEQSLNMLPTDIKKKILRSHVKFFTSNFYDLMSRSFPKGFSSNSYMRVLKSILESLFEDIKESEAATKKQEEPGETQPEGTQPEESTEVPQEPEETGEQPEDEGETAPEETSEEGETGEEEVPENPEDTPKIFERKYKVGDKLVQKSTGKIGVVTSISADGDYILDTSEIIQENVSFLSKLRLLFESSIITVSEDDLDYYEQEPSDNPSPEESDGESEGDESESGEESDDNPESGEPSEDGETSEDDEGGENGEEGEGEEGEGEGSGDGSSEGEDDGEGSISPPSLDQDKMDNSGKDSEGGNGEEGDGGEGDASPSSDLPSLPPEDQEDQEDSPGNSNSSPGDSEGAGENSDDLDQLRSELDKSHEESKTGLSDSSNDYLEEDEITRAEADDEIDDDEAKDNIKESVKEAVADAKENNQNLDDVLKGLDPGEVERAFTLDMDGIKKQTPKSQWKLMFRKLISTASGYDLKRDNARPSRKVEGLWGANVKVPMIKEVVIMLDCSASMSSPMFKAIFAELQEIGKLPELKDTWVHMILWGGSAEYKRFKGLNSTTIKKMYAYGKKPLGATYPLAGYDLLMKKVRAPDLVIMLSDSEFSDYNTWKRHEKRMLPSDSGWSSVEIKGADLKKMESFLKKIARKSVYVSIDKSQSHKLEMLDPMYKRRLINIEQSLSREGSGFDED